MATTQNTFTGDGSNLGPFSFTFKWLEPTDIKVTVAGVLKTVGTHYNLQSLNYSTKTGGQVLFTAGNAPANGAAIVIYRQTDDTDLAATFSSGSAIRAQDLNSNFIQGLYVAQEVNNSVVTANATANTALTNSNTAISTANTASTNASAAVATANTASTNASAAVSTANTASANATTAINTANSAAAAVANVVTYTIIANVAAIPATPANNTAVEVTNSTGIESFTPLSGIPVGFVGSSGLSVRIIYSTVGSTWNWVQYFPNDPEARYLKLAGGTLTGAIGVTAGTAAAPSIFVSGDTNTGLYSPGADQVAISTGGSGRLFVDASGNVGVGITPTTRFHVYQAGSTQAGLVETNQSASVINFKSTGQSSGQPQVGCAASDMILNTNGTERLRITSAGFVGVGTSSPLNALDVAGSISLSSGGSNVIRVLQSVNAAGYTGPGFYSQTSIGYGVASGGTHRWIGGDGNTELMRLTSTGLGIGTTSAGYALDVKGIIRTTGTNGWTTNGDTAWLYFGDENNRVGGTRGGTMAFYTDYAPLELGAGGGVGATSTAQLITFKTGTSERARIDSSGRLLVGTSSSSGNLSVQGNESDPIARLSGITGGIANYSLDIKQSLGSTINFVQRWFTSSQQESTVMSFGSGGLFSTAVYSSVVGGTNRDVYVDNAGLIGYVSSTRNSKVNINDLATVNWLYRLNPVSFNRRKLDEEKRYTNEFYSELEFGLIAEEVEQVAPELCFYDDVNGQQELRGVHYSKLITPMLKALQQATQRIEALEAEIAALKAQ